MINIKDETLQSFLYNVKEIANESKTKQFISWTEKIHPLNLLALFSIFENETMDRMFWANSKRDFILFGLGSAANFVATEDRFSLLEKKWYTFIERAIIYNPYTDSGTGIVAFGGMSFDPLRKRSDLWKKFPTSQLTIPEYMLVMNNGEYYFTVNRYIHPEQSVEALIEEITAKKEVLFSPSSTTNQLPQHKIVQKTEIDPNKWKDSVRKAVDAIQADEAKKIVLARELRIKLNKVANISHLINKLLKTQPNSYIFAYEQGEDCFLGATPERLVELEGMALLSTCLAGTAPRGKTEKEDKEIAQALLNDQKNREEHDYVVQMITNSIENYCENIDIPKEPIVITLRNLQHLYTPVRATLKQHVSVFQLIESLHPTPALGGVPREKALQFIREEELLDRGWYGAPIGWLDSNANSEFAVAIRSGLVQADEVSLFAGCGVMKDSDPEMEYEETNVKFLPLLTILEDENES